MSIMTTEFDCDCLDNLERMLLKKFGAGSDVKIECSPCLNFDSGEIYFSLGQIPVSYRSKKTDGSFSRMRKKSQVYFSFCPMCGKAKPAKEEGA